MAEGLPYPRMDWTCSNLPNSFEKFERHYQCLMGHLKERAKKNMVHKKGAQFTHGGISPQRKTKTQVQYFNVLETLCRRSQIRCSRFIFFTVKCKEMNLNSLQRLTISARDCDFADQPDQMIRD